MELPIGEKFELWKWQRTHLALNTLQSTQLDAYALNDELFSILQQSLNTALNPLMALTSLSVEKYHSVLFGCLKILFTAYPLFKGSYLAGFKLRNCQFVDSESSGEPSKFKKSAWIFSTLVLPSLYNEILSRKLDIQNLKVIKKITSLSTLMNLLLFLLTSKYFMHNFYVHLRLTDLLHGRFPRLTDRLLGMEICDNSPGKVHTIFSAYMDRILIWNTLTEFILAIAPQLESLGQFLKFNRQSSRLRTTSVVACCGICGLSETNLPFITDPCSHIFCHFCIQNHLITSNECPLCQYTIDSIQYFDRT